MSTEQPVGNNVANVTLSEDNPIDLSKLRVRTPELTFDDITANISSINNSNNIILPQSNFDKEIQSRVHSRSPTIKITEQQLDFFEDSWQPLEPLGEPGQFGIAFSCYRKNDVEKKIFAVKQISKIKCYDINEQERIDILGKMRNEIEIHRGLSHSNIVNLYEVYEDRNYIWLVMDHLSGGELLGRIIKNDKLTEKDAANITKQVLDALNYMQSKNICHLDLKPDNILFDSDKEDAVVKVIDFGMAQIIPRLNKLKQLVGTKYYIAPEVIESKYDRAADVWSLGVIIFCMLFGFQPFCIEKEEDDDAIYEKIKEGFIPEVRSGYGRWFPEDIPISDEAKDLLSKMLIKDIKKRYTVIEVLSHPWIRQQIHDRALPRIIFNSLINFTKTCRLKYVVSKMFESKLDLDHYAETLEVFRKWDANGDGELTLEEFKQGMKQSTTLNDEEIEECFKHLDHDNNKIITIDELIISCAFDALISVDERINDIFIELDYDQNGILDVEEIDRILSKYQIGKIGRARSILLDIDINGDGKIDYDDFLHVLHPQFNESIVIPDMNRVRSRGFGSFNPKIWNDIIKTSLNIDSNSRITLFVPSKIDNNDLNILNKEKEKNEIPNTSCSNLLIDDIKHTNQNILKDNEHATINSSSFIIHQNRCITSNINSKHKDKNQNDKVRCLIM